jgi:hypothetical protein
LVVLAAAKVQFFTIQTMPFLKKSVLSFILFYGRQQQIIFSLSPHRYTQTAFA